MKETFHLPIDEKKRGGNILLKNEAKSEIQSQHIGNRSVDRYVTNETQKSPIQKSNDFHNSWVQSSEINDTSYIRSKFNSVNKSFNLEHESIQKVMKNTQNAMALTHKTQRGVTKLTQNNLSKSVWLPNANEKTLSSTFGIGDSQNSSSQSNTSYFNLLKRLKKRQEIQEMYNQSSADSRGQYMINRQQRNASQDVSRSICMPDRGTVKELLNQFSNGIPEKIMKNTQTNQFEFREGRQQFKTNREFDLLTHQYKDRPATISKARCRYISDFVEQAQINQHHFSHEFQAAVEKGPSVYGLMKGEFGKIINAMPETRQIIRTERRSFS